MATPFNDMAAQMSDDISPEVQGDVDEALFDVRQTRSGAPPHLSFLARIPFGNRVYITAFRFPWDPPVDLSRERAKRLISKHRRWTVDLANSFGDALAGDSSNLALRWNLTALLARYLDECLEGSSFTALREALDAKLANLPVTVAERVVEDARHFFDDEEGVDLNRPDGVLNRELAKRMQKVAARRLHSVAVPPNRKAGALARSMRESPKRARSPKYSRRMRRL